MCVFVCLFVCACVCVFVCVALARACVSRYTKTERGEGRGAGEEVENKGRMLNEDTPFSKPQSTTYRIPLIVTEVSAILVDSTTLRGRTSPIETEINRPTIPTVWGFHPKHNKGKDS